MEPITATIVAALLAGATAAAKDVATAAIKDAYAGLKRLIKDRYERAAPFVEAVEADPTAKPEQQVLAQQLSRADANRARRAVARRCNDVASSRSRSWPGRLSGTVCHSRLHPPFHSPMPVKYNIQ